MRPRTQDLQRNAGLLKAYHFSNPNAAGSKDQLDYASGPEDYHAVHGKYHPEYRGLLYARNYYDIFFFDLDGNCIYSVYKELDFATNFGPNGTGPYKDSGLGLAFQAALREPASIHETAWMPYAPSAGALASFRCTGVSHLELEARGLKRGAQVRRCCWACFARRCRKRHSP